MRIYPLSKNTLEDAVSLAASVFSFHENQTQADISSDLTKSYLLTEMKKTLEKASKNSFEYKRAKKFINYMRYQYEMEGHLTWVALDNRKVQGVIGLAWGKEDYDAWLIWFCVNPGLRRQGIGSRLLDYSISQARGLGFSELNLRTSTRPGHADAQTLYESRGFEVYDRERKRKNKKRSKGYTVLYRALKL